MQRLHASRAKSWVDRLTVNHEEGLSTAQLMVCLFFLLCTPSCLRCPSEHVLSYVATILTNDDLKPVEPARRQWGPWNYVGFWVADSFNINTWMISSTSIVNGLSWWQAWLSVWVGYSIAGAFVCMTGRIGATYHIGFPVVNRASFGIWGSLWPVLNRSVLAAFWYGVQAYIGGHCVYLMIRSIWLSWDRTTIPNTFPANSGTTTADYASFFIFWLVSLPAIWFPVHKIRHLFTVKAYFVPTAGIAFFIWALVRAGGVGPIINQPAKLHGSDLAWEFVKGVLSSIANFATLIVNDPDFSRFAGKPRDAFWSQLLTIPIGFAVTCFIGIFVSSSSVIIYPGTEPIWDPLDLLERFIDDGGSAQRFGVFVIALAFALAQLGTNIAANSISAGTDFTALLPRFLNIRRGGYLCAAIGLALCPYQFLSSSNNFETYLSAYSVFLSSIAGVMVSDYYFVRRGYLGVKELYDARRSSPYYFTYGVNWRAYAAYIAGILINVVGFAGAVNGGNVPIGATYIYNLNFFAGFIVSSAVYWICCKVFPIPACSEKWLEVGDQIDEITLAYDDNVSITGSDRSRNDEEAGLDGEYNKHLNKD
ncbi:permease for cytosine/purines, uracil, thiamine, allantoin-domain-containing protein [Nemania sp. FL0031]|nr:permease for cytosine/purines, uracil, thiamine, allantoin-domain-containing protein [Nemania sp. FL0031]